jgi:8-oxo-dGTP pyrophosphatase MutT (NUDIX family)
VLVPLYRSAADGGLHAVFTRRRDDLRSHPGEISFPGGRQDDADEDLRATALRESHEEIGLPPEGVHLVGALPPDADRRHDTTRSIRSWASSKRA